MKASEFVNPMLWYGFFKTRMSSPSDDQAYIVNPPFVTDTRSSPAHVAYELESRNNDHICKWHQRWADHLQKNRQDQIDHGYGTAVIEPDDVVAESKRKRVQRESAHQTPRPHHQGKQEHDVVLRAIGIPVEGDGQEHGDIMREILGH